MPRRRVDAPAAEPSAKSYTMKADCSNCGRTHVYHLACGRRAAFALNQMECQTCGCCNVLTNPRMPEAA